MKTKFKSRFLTQICPEISMNIKETNGILLFKTESTLIYKGHIPNAAYILVSGNIDVEINRYKISLGPKINYIYGLNEILTNRPIMYNAKIAANSYLVVLDKSTIKELNLNHYLKVG